MRLENDLELQTSNTYVTAEIIPARKMVVIDSAGKIAVADETSTNIAGFTKELKQYAAGKPCTIITSDGFEAMVQCLDSDVTVGADAVINPDGLIVDSGTAGAGSTVVGTILSLPEAITFYEYETEYTANVCRILFNK